MGTWRGRICGEHRSRWAVDEWDGAVFGVGTFPLFVFAYALASILIASRASSLLPSSTVYRPSRHFHPLLPPPESNRPLEPISVSMLIPSSSAHPPMPRNGGSLRNESSQPGGAERPIVGCLCGSASRSLGVRAKEQLWCLCVSSPFSLCRTFLLCPPFFLPSVLRTRIDADDPCRR
ncbi:hypothetical protein FA13DRAFT_1176934 [Coprinellus micaceus]|uniref:Uncharacterized protein n=1 Tax=Coprinellus micaceus TaxID=71717 RepID=A0A4Y7SU12_COPMI|nr:hypothetical protein FA13DRAFT_1176934 [Coprinellus micaceus]